MYKLTDLYINQTGVIKKISKNYNEMIRLLEMGLRKDKKIKKVLQSPSKNINAYLIDNTIIALRNDDAKNIEIEVSND